MRRVIAVAVALLVVAVPARAQQELLAECAEQDLPEDIPADIRQDIQAEFAAVCGRVVNALTVVQPTVGIAFSGGNPILGTGTTFGTAAGFVPHVNVTARVNVALVDIPDITSGAFGRIASRTEAGAALEAVETTGLPLFALQGDVAIGLFNGFGLGPVDGVGAVDLLGSVAYVPQVEQIHLNSPIVNAGAGVRIGILEQGIVTPGISVSALYRTLIQEIDIGSVDEGDPAEFHAGLSTWSVRAAISKGVALANFALGGGYDFYSTEATLLYELECATDECRSVTDDGGPLVVRGDVAGALSTGAWNVFGSVGIEFLAAHLVAEVGYQKATDLVTAEDLAEAGIQAESIDELSGGSLFGSLGLRLSF